MLLREVINLNKQAIQPKWLTNHKFSSESQCLPGADFPRLHFTAWSGDLGLDINTVDAKAVQMQNRHQVQLYRQRRDLLSPGVYPVSSTTWLDSTLVKNTALVEEL